jgi:hemerythrin-like domain-containing protein
MRFSLFNASLGDPTGRETFVDEAREYVDLQRRHLARENQGLLPLADQLLTDEDDQAVIAEFRSREEEGLPREEVRSRVRKICKKHLVSFEREVKVH